ncbi:type II toxin-antitoxin system RelE/ParE family toxin [Kaistella sp.]|uniref:type II toxin-antitoxin system RelE/ParE family toxin n=1 Tax=Kaistella sp. TaxID=2782235 RepID=UPI0035A1AA5B
MNDTETIYKIFYQFEAEEDLKEIANYYQYAGGEDIAEMNIDRILNSIDSLEKMPFRCSTSDFSKNIRKLNVPNLPYIVFFKIIGENVYVLNIFHTKRSQKILQRKYQNS